MAKSKFHISSNGYNIEQVDRFISVVTKEFESVLANVEKQEQTIQELKALVYNYEEKRSNIELINEELANMLQDFEQRKLALETEIGFLEDKICAYQDVFQEAASFHLSMLESINNIDEEDTTDY